MRRLSAFAVAALLLLASPVARAGDILIFAAASTKDVIQEAAKEFAAAGGGHVVASFSSSGDLAKQIENGAPATIFISADEKWMDYVAQRKLIVPDSRRDLLGNVLVLVAPADSKMAPGTDGIAAKLDGGKLAIGDPDSVPAGKYAQAALQKLGQWQDLQPALVRAKDVRSALAFVERGEAAAGIVYATDALASKKARIVANFPEASHPPIVYPIALVAGKDDAGAQAFYRFLFGPQAREIFLSAGFSLTGAGAAAD
jgi:molybdate transport system substrate-binding protein